MPGDSPTVSIVTATYNRANVLRFTIESVRAQTFGDWELIVAGDACTDETEEVVRSCDDPRIRFFNRAVNSGEQATPNNDGVRLACGKYLAFVNHDDLWSPDHLAVCLGAIERTNADLVWTLTVAIDHDGSAHLAGASAGDAFEPYVIAAPASSWLMRREVALAVGPWRPAREIYLPPSQEWLHRAWKSGRVLRPLKVPTVLAVLSGSRKRSYAERPSGENEQYAARLAADPHLLLRMTAEIAARDAAAGRDLSIYRHLGRAFRNAIRRICVALQIHPAAVLYAAKYRRRGGFLDSLRKIRGLPPLPRPGDIA